MVRYSEDLSLYKQSFSASLLVYAESRLEAKLEFSVSFSSLGPKLGSSEIDIPPITCSTKDLKWSIKLAEVVAAD